MLKNFAALVFGLGMALLVIWGIDRAFSYLAAQQTGDVVREPDIYGMGFIDSPHYGYQLRPNLDLTTTKSVNGTPIYTVTYTTDEQGRRVVPANVDEEQASRPFAAFFGCSFTFGEGVENEETLPNQFIQMNPRYHGYNFGCPGYGPQHMLMALEKGEVRETITESHGVAIYSLIPHHVNRAVGRIGVVTRWGKRFPYYRLENGDLVHAGYFHTDRPWTQRVYELLSRSGIVQYYQINLPILRSYHYELVAQMIVRARDLFEAQFETAEFIVLVYPQFGDWPFSLDSVITRLNEEGVHVLDFRDMPIDQSLHAVHPEHDLHPSPALYREMAIRLTEALQSNASHEAKT